MDSRTPESTPRNHSGLISALSLVAGAVGGFFMHNEEKHQRIQNARKWVNRFSRLQEHHDVEAMLAENEWQGMSKPKLSQFANKEVKLAEHYLKENRGIKQGWHGLTQSWKMILGAMVGLMIVAPIAGYFANRRAAKNAELSDNHQVALATENEELRQQLAEKEKSFTAALDKERAGAAPSPTRA